MSEKTRVLLIGAAGRMGRCTLPVLLRQKNVEVGIADCASVEKLAAENGVEAVAIDTNNEKELTEIIAKWDIVVSTAAFINEVTLPIIRACIAGKTDYVDICATTDVTLNAFALKEEAEKAGVTILSGIGTAPAVTCLLAKLGIEELDTAEEAIIGYIYPVPAPEECPDYEKGFVEGHGSGTWVTELGGPHGEVPMLINGKVEKVSGAWNHQKLMRYPYGPAVEMVPSDYPEVYIMPISYPEIPNVSTVVQFDSKLATEAWHQALLDLEAGKTMDEAGARFFRTMANDFDKDSELVALGKVPVVNIIGTKDGKKVCCAVRTSEWIKTENVLVAAYDWIISEKRPAGVFTAEQIIEPLDLFKAAYAVGGEEEPAGGLVVKEVIEL